MRADGSYEAVRCQGTAPGRRRSPKASLPVRGAWQGPAKEREGRGPSAIAALLSPFLALRTPRRSHRRRRRRCRLGGRGRCRGGWSHSSPGVRRSLLRLSLQPIPVDVEDSRVETMNTAEKSCSNSRPINLVVMRFPSDGKVTRES